MIVPSIAKPLQIPVPFAGGFGYFVWCDVSLEEAHKVLGPPTATMWDDGLGEADFWALEYPCGLQVLYEFTHYPSGGSVVADSPEIQHLLRHLPFESSRCHAISESGLKQILDRIVSAYPNRRSEIESLHKFQVWRQDDHGNSFTVGAPTSERDANCWLSQLEASGHKQMYWRDRVS
jgi:hypothetical protein